MSTQRYISTSFWDDEWVQSLNLTNKALYLYLLTNTLTNIAGVYKISTRRISFDTGLEEKEVINILNIFIQAGKVYRINEYIILPNWTKHQKWETRTSIKAGIEKIFNSLPPEVLKLAKNVCYYLKTLEEPPLPSTPPPEPEASPPLPSYLDSDLNLDKDIDINSDPPSGEKLFISLWQKNGDVFNAFARLDQPNEWRNFWDKCNFSPQHIETAVNNVVNAVKSGLLQRRFIPSTPDKFVLHDWFNRGLDDFKPKEEPEKPERKTNVPDFEATEKMLEEQEKSREFAVSGSLVDELNKIKRGRQ